MAPPSGLPACKRINPSDLLLPVSNTSDETRDLTLADVAGSLDTPLAHRFCTAEDGSTVLHVIEGRHPVAASATGGVEEYSKDWDKEKKVEYILKHVLTLSVVDELRLAEIQGAIDRSRLQRQELLSSSLLTKSDYDKFYDSFLHALFVFGVAVPVALDVATAIAAKRGLDKGVLYLLSYYNEKNKLGLGCTGFGFDGLKMLRLTGLAAAVYGLTYADDVWHAISGDAGKPERTAKTAAPTTPLNEVESGLLFRLQPERTRLSKMTSANLDAEYERLDAIRRTPEGPLVSKLNELNLLNAENVIISSNRFNQPQYESWKRGKTTTQIIEEAEKVRDDLAAGKDQIFLQWVRTNQPGMWDIIGVVLGFSIGTNWGHRYVGASHRFFAAQDKNRGIQHTLARRNAASDLLGRVQESTLRCPEQRVSEMERALQEAEAHLQQEGVTVPGKATAERPAMAPAAEPAPVAEPVPADGTQPDPEMTRAPATGVTRTARVAETPQPDGTPVIQPMSFEFRDGWSYPLEQYIRFLPQPLQMEIAMMQRMGGNFANLSTIRVYCEWRSAGLAGTNGLTSAKVPYFYLRQASTSFSPTMESRRGGGTNAGNSNPGSAPMSGIGKVFHFGVNLAAVLVVDWELTQAGITGTGRIPAQLATYHAMDWASYLLRTSLHQRGYLSQAPIKPSLTNMLGSVGVLTGAQILTGLTAHGLGGALGVQGLKFGGIANTVVTVASAVGIMTWAGLTESGKAAMAVATGAGLKWYAVGYAGTGLSAGAAGAGLAALGAGGATALGFAAGGKLTDLIYDNDFKDPDKRLAYIAWKQALDEDGSSMPLAVKKFYYGFYTQMLSSGSEGHQAIMDDVEGRVDNMVGTSRDFGKQMEDMLLMAAQQSTSVTGVIDWLQFEAKVREVYGDFATAIRSQYDLLKLTGHRLDTQRAVKITEALKWEGCPLKIDRALVQAIVARRAKEQSDEHRLKLLRYSNEYLITQRDGITFLPTTLSIDQKEYLQGRGMEHLMGYAAGDLIYKTWKV